MEERVWHGSYDYNVPTSMRFPRIPLQELMTSAAVANPDKAVMHYRGTEISFWELREMSVRMAHALAGLGVKKGDCVGLHLPNAPQYPIAYYGALHLGAIVVNLNPLFTPEELVSLAKQAGLKAMVTCDTVLANVEEVCKTVEIPIVIATSLSDFGKGTEKSTPASRHLPDGWHDFSRLLDLSAGTALPRVEISPQDPALIQFTGGTTGTPKGATLTHANLVAASFIISTWFNPTMQFVPFEKRNVLMALPLFHVYGNIVGMSWAMLNCATMILVPRFEIDSFMDLLARYGKISSFPAVPTMINAVVNHPRAKELNLARRIEMLHTGGAPTSGELMDRVNELGIRCSEGWGMSETTSLGITSPNYGLKKKGSIGIPLIGMDAKLVDVDTGTKEPPAGEPGELLVKGPVVMRGYWKDPERTAEELKDGWMHTGDIAKRDEDGYFYIVDRKKDMVIAGGYNIYPRDIDEVLCRHPKVLDAVSLGVPHAYRGETLKAYVVLRPGETATDEEMIDFCKQKLAVYKVPKMVEFRDDLPKSAVGKVLRKILLEEETQRLKAKKP